MRLLDLLETSAQYFAKNNVESPRLTMELLLAHVLGKTRLQLYLDFERDISEETLAILRPMVKKRAEGFPLEYITGCREFMGRVFKLTPDVLIPRPETELLFETAAALVVPEGGPLVDVGTGSGVLAVSLAAKFPNLPVAALDISPAALAVARENGAGLANITFVQSDLLAQCPHPRAQLIVANLPYIPSGQIPALSREVRYEPTLALDGGADGLDIIRRLIAQARGRADWLVLEIGDGQAQAVCDLLTADGFAVERVAEDIRKTPRVVVGKMLQ